MTETTLFEKIIAKQIPTIIHEDDLCIAFETLRQQLLSTFSLCLKKLFQSCHVSPEDQALLGHLDAH